MIFSLFRQARSQRLEGTIAALYGAIVAQARAPSFYADYGVPDTMEARFDMIVLHVALFFRRVRDEAADVKALGQGVFDAFCRDMEGNLRELGTSDLKVPKQMRAFGEAFYGRAAAYDSALAADDDGALAETLARNVLAGAAPADARPLAAYVREAVRDLAGQTSEEFKAGAIRFPAVRAGNASLV